MYYLLDFADAGGLMAYGSELAVMSRRAGDYIDKILKGARPGDLPVEQPKEYVLVVNLKAAEKLSSRYQSLYCLAPAKSLDEKWGSSTHPEAIVLRADEVIR